MGIGTKNLEEYTSLKTLFGRTVPFFASPDGVAALDDEFPVDASAVGTAITLTTSPFVLPPNGCCIGFSDGAVTLDGSSSATFQIVGFNQFNEPVTESVTITNAVATQSLNAFRQVTSVTLTAKTGIGAGGTCDIGWLNFGTGRRVGLPFKLRSSTDISAVIPYSATAPTNSPTLSTSYHTILLPTSGFTASVMNVGFLVLSQGALLKY